MAENARLHGRGVGLQRELDEPRVGLGVLAERDDAADVRVLRLPLQPRELRIVAVDDGGAARLDALKNLGLRVGDGLDRGKELQMHRLDGGDDRHMRPHEPGQRRDLARMVHAHFQHGVFRALRAARERQRHAPVIVVGCRRRMRLAVLRQRKPQRLLGAGLADRAGDADELGLAARTRGTRERDQAVQHVRHREQRRVLGKFIAPARRNDGKAGVLLQCRLDELMPVARIALDREERLARRDRAGVDRKPGDAGRQRAMLLGAHRLRHRLDRPQRRAHATFSRNAASTSS